MNKKVLWIRHCEACHNKLTLKQTFSKRIFKEPLCKYKGVDSAKKTGKEIAKYNLNLGNTIYCSFLPRAIETAMFVAYGINKQFGKKVIKNVQVISYISEKTSFLDGISRKLFKYTSSMSTTSVKCATSKIKSLLEKYKHLKYLPRIIFNDNDCNQLDKISNPLNKTCNNCDDVCKSKNVKKDYIKFKDEILPELKNNKINLIVSHGFYIKKNIVKGKMFNNLEHILVKYTKKSIDDDVKSEFLEINGKLRNKSKTMPKKPSKKPSKKSIKNSIKRSFKKI
jgi:bisphosphoglycerate-dependent phosphoglycerate mutase